MFSVTLRVTPGHCAIMQNKRDFGNVIDNYTSRVVFFLQFKCDNCGNVVPFAGKAHTYQLQWCSNRFYILQWVSFSQSFNCLWILRISGFQVSPICQLVWMLTLGSFGPHGGSVSATARSKDSRTQKSHIFLVPSSSFSSWLSIACH